MAFVVFLDDRDAAAVEAALRSAPPSHAAAAAATLAGGFGEWRLAPFGLSPCADPEVASPTGSRRIEVLSMSREELASLLDACSVASGDGYLSTLALDVRECGEDF